MPAADMNKTRLEMGEVAYDQVWRDRIRNEEKILQHRVTLEEIMKATGLAINKQPEKPKSYLRQPPRSIVSVPANYDLMVGDDNRAKKAYLRDKLLKGT